MKVAIKVKRGLSLGGGQIEEKGVIGRQCREMSGIMFYFLTWVVVT